MAGCHSQSKGERLGLRVWGGPKGVVFENNRQMRSLRLGGGTEAGAVGGQAEFCLKWTDTGGWVQTKEPMKTQNAEAGGGKEAYTAAEFKEEAAVDCGGRVAAVAARVAAESGSARHCCIWGETATAGRPSRRVCRAQTERIEEMQGRPRPAAARRREALGSVNSKKIAWASFRSAAESMPKSSHEAAATTAVVVRCVWLVSRSGYYDWCGVRRAPGPRARGELGAGQASAKSFARGSRKTYGSRAGAGAGLQGKPAANRPAVMRQEAVVGAAALQVSRRDNHSPPCRFPFAPIDCSAPLTPATAQPGGG